MYALYIPAYNYKYIYSRSKVKRIQNYPQQCPGTHTQKWPWHCHARTTFVSNSARVDNCTIQNKFLVVWEPKISVNAQLQLERIIRLALWRSYQRGDAHKDKDDENGIVLDGDDDGRMAHRQHGEGGRTGGMAIEMEVGTDDMPIEADDRMEVETVATPPFNWTAPVSDNAPSTNSWRAAQALPNSDTLEENKGAQPISSCFATESRSRQSRSRPNVIEWIGWWWILHRTHCLRDAIHGNDQHQQSLMQMTVHVADSTSLLDRLASWYQSKSDVRRLENGSYRPAIGETRAAQMSVSTRCNQYRHLQASHHWNRRNKERPSRESQRNAEYCAREHMEVPHSQRDRQVESQERVAQNSHQPASDWLWKSRQTKMDHVSVC